MPAEKEALSKQDEPGRGYEKLNAREHQLGDLLPHSKQEMLDRLQWEYTTSECNDCDAC